MPISAVEHPEVYIWRDEDAHLWSEKAIYFDLDGTLVDLYSVDEWLPKLRSFDASPYKDAPPLVDMSLVSEFCTAARRLGYRIGIVTWLAAVSDGHYDDAVVMAKLDWIESHFDFDDVKEVIMSPYGYPKQDLVDVYQNAILIDDSEDNRLSWESASDNRVAYDATDIPMLISLFNFAYSI